MVYGFGTVPPERKTQSRGRPRALPSSHLRTLAWLRHLLDSLDDLQHWALGNKDAPSGWKQRAPDAQHLRELFRNGLPAGFEKDPYKRHPSLLDAIFDRVLHGKHSASAWWFGDKLLKGEVSPDRTRLQRFEGLVPGSLEAFDRVPKGMDPGFYDALDFLSPWYGRLHLWRVIDPRRSDEGWERLLENGHVVQDGDLELMGSGFPRGLWRRRFELWDLSSDERRMLGDEVAMAVAHFAFPDRVDTPAFGSYAEEVAAARAACEQDRLVNPIRKRVEGLPEAEQWAALTDALAAMRLEQMAEIGKFTEWWIESIMQGMASTIERREMEWFCPLTHARPPLSTYLRNALAERKTT
jgi:hypothetical protein